jgi:hypothetical protein
VLRVHRPGPRRPAAAPDRQPLDESAAESVRKYPADQRAKVDVLASVLEDIAEKRLSFRV